MRTASATAVFAALALLGGCGNHEVSVAQPAAVGQQAFDKRFQFDRARNRTWSLSHEGVSVQEARQRRIPVAIPGWVWADTAYGCLPDLALGPKGEAIITSNVVPTLWRVDPETLAVTQHPLALEGDEGRDVGFSGLTYSARHGAWFGISDAHRSLWRIDAALTRAEKVRLSEPLRHGCEVAMVTRLAALDPL